MSSVVTSNCVFCEKQNITETNSIFKPITFQKFPKQIPIKVVFTEEQSISNTTSFSCSTEDNNQFYPFSILKSRKKEKKYLRHKFNTIISRVYNMDCLLKKKNKSKIFKICLYYSSKLFFN